jgi:phage terminase small subunit
MDPSNPDDFGPLMAALTEKQRRFVMAMASDPFGSATKWAKSAGYSNKSEGAKVTAHYLMHDPRIAPAAREFAGDLMNVQGPVVAVAVMMKIAMNQNHPQQLKAAEMIANRVGLHETQEIHVHKTDNTGAALLERIKVAAAALGVDPAQFLGANTEPKLIEGKVE